jgi:hypothetical protein
METATTFQMPKTVQSVPPEVVQEIELPDFEDWLEPPDQDLSQAVSAYPKREQV